MKLLLLAGILSLSIVGATVVRADECTGKLTDDQNKVFASLPPADQETLVKMKNKDGSPVTCEFRGALLTMLGHSTPEERPAAFHYLVKNTLAKQQ
jgi:hypothetical protein